MPSGIFLRFSWVVFLCLIVRAPAAAETDAAIPEARLKAAQGRWNEAEARLKAWENDPQRRGGGGEVLFWRGWAALHRHRREEADTLFTLASAYSDEPVSQRALEYRFALTLDTGKGLYAYILGLPESPLPDSARAAALKGLPSSSPLYPYGLWELARISETAGDTISALDLLRKLAGDLSSAPGRRAHVRMTRLKLEPRHPDSAMADYERLLLQHQQGVSAEMARSRVQKLRNATPPSGRGD